MKLAFNIEKDYLIIFFSDILYYLIIGINLILIFLLFSKCDINITFYQYYAKIYI